MFFLTFAEKSNRSLSGATSEPLWSASFSTLLKAKLRICVPVWLFMTGLLRTWWQREQRAKFWQTEWNLIFFFEQLHITDLHCDIKYKYKTHCWIFESKVIWNNMRQTSKMYNILYSKVWNSNVADFHSIETLTSTKSKTIDISTQNDTYLINR